MRCGLGSSGSWMGLRKSSSLTGRTVDEHRSLATAGDRRNLLGGNDGEPLASDSRLRRPGAGPKGLIGKLKAARREVERVYAKGVVQLCLERRVAGVLADEPVFARSDALDLQDVLGRLPARSWAWRRTRPSAASPEPTVAQ